GQIYLGAHQLRLAILAAGLTESTSAPFGRIGVAHNNGAAILFSERDKLTHSRVWIALATAHRVDNETARIAFADEMQNPNRRPVMPSAAHVDKGVVERVLTRRQFERSRVIDSGVDRLIVEERADIGPKFRVPLGTSRSRIGRTLCRDGAIA